MNKRLPLLVAGIVFTLVAIVHILRLVYGWEIIIRGDVVPMSFSLVGAIIAGVLALWMFTASRE